MENNDFIFDITDVDIDISLDRSKRHKFLNANLAGGDYNKKIKINDTIVIINFLSTEKLNCKSILKVLN